MKTGAEQVAPGLAATVARESARRADGRLGTQHWPEAPVQALAHPSGAAGSGRQLSEHHGINVTLASK